MKTSAASCETTPRNKREATQPNPPSFPNSGSLHCRLFPKTQHKDFSHSLQASLILPLPCFSLQTFIMCVLSHQKPHSSCCINNGGDAPSQDFGVIITCKGKFSFVAWDKIKILHSKCRGRPWKGNIHQKSICNSSSSHPACVSLSFFKVQIKPRGHPGTLNYRPNTSQGLLGFILGLQPVFLKISAGNWMHGEFQSPFTPGV